MPSKFRSYQYTSMRYMPSEVHAHEMCAYEVSLIGVVCLRLSEFRFEANDVKRSSLADPALTSEF